MDVCGSKALPWASLSCLIVLLICTFKFVTINSALVCFPSPTSYNKSNKEDMSFLDEYKRLAKAETDNEFPEHMEHDGLSESDRGMYEEVLNKMRADMDKANEDMKKNSGSWGDVCEEVNGNIQNKTYAMSEEIKQKRTNYGNQKPIIYGDGTTKRVSEALGLYFDGYRCPKCGRVMYEEPEAFVCGSCGYSETRDGRNIQFYFIDSSFVKTSFAPEDNERMNAVFRRANQNK